VVVVVTVLLTAAGASADDVRVPLDEGLRAVATPDGETFLETRPGTGEGLLSLTRRTTGSTRAARTVADANGGGEILHAGRWYRIPSELLTPELKARVTAALALDGCLTDDGWVHEVAGGPGRPVESLWRISERFTGQGENFATIRAFNRMEDEGLRPRDRLVVPASLLVPAFRAAARHCSTPRQVGELAYERDGGEDYAVYRLQRGEALYSSVVVRFTGLTTAADVNALAAEIAELNGIGDVTSIPAGRRIRIPFAELLPEYLPPNEPRRLAYERERAATEGIQNPVLARDLSGITIILDAGHGGRDPGNTHGEVWESIYVYDIMLRVKQVLEATTAATVVPTTGDGGLWRPQERDVLPFSRNHSVLTEPPYRIEDSVTGVHLRWYLANSVLARSLAGHGDPDKAVFVSLHADSLHPSLRGAMAYVASASLSHGRYGKQGAVFASRREVRERPVVEFNLTERRRSEGLSRELAEGILDAFRRRGLAVYDQKPVRDKIIRHRRPPFVPAVLRYNAVPAKVLLEICNLANLEDRTLIQTAAYRQQVAEAVAEALVDYYGTADAAPGGVQTAAAAR
jgi:N-acetylmuramoyl-L-alanine amidase